MRRPPVAAHGVEAPDGHLADVVGCFADANAKRGAKPFLPSSMGRRLLLSVSLMLTSFTVQMFLCHGAKTSVGSFAAIDAIHDA